MRTERRTDRLKDGRIDMTKLKVAVRNFAKVSKSPPLFFLKFRTDDGYTFIAETCSLVLDEYRHILC
jgi:hypothetical protein